MSDSLRAFKEFHKAFLPFVFWKTEVAEIFEIALLTHGHVLIEDLPWVGKTTIAKAFARLLGLSHSRIQWTSDSLPQDVVGWETFDFSAKEFVVRKGPVFAEVVLIDEINRMHPKTQSAFLECMEEKSVSVAGKTFPLPEFHFVIATQNPLEYVGTFLLPEAQKDRFTAVVKIWYPSDEAQFEIVKSGSSSRMAQVLESLAPAISSDVLRSCVEEVSEVAVWDAVAKKLVAFAGATRSDDALRFGVSPRWLNLFASALRAKAYLEGRDYVIPEDGISLVGPMLAHRVSAKDAAFPVTEIAWILSELYRKHLG